MYNLIETIKNDKFATVYKSWQGLECYRVFAPLAWYFLQCNKAGITPEYNNGSYTAVATDFDFDFCEGDCILAIHA